MTENNHTETTDTIENEPQEAVETAQEAVETEPKVFDAEYVASLRAEAAEGRVKAKRFDELARELFTTKVAALGRLQDATDMAFDEALLDDPEALQKAVDELVARKPHLAARKLQGSVGQGATTPAPVVSLVDAMRMGV